MILLMNLCVGDFELVCMKFLLILKLLLKKMYQGFQSIVFCLLFAVLVLKIKMISDQL